MTPPGGGGGVLFVKLGGLSALAVMILFRLSLCPLWFKVFIIGITCRDAGVRDSPLVAVLPLTAVQCPVDPHPSCGGNVRHAAL